MINIADNIKELFKSDSVKKYMRVKIGTLPYIENDKIYYESFQLKESIINGQNWEFTGCIASEMTIKIQSDSNFTKSNWKGTSVSVELAVEIDSTTISDYIPLFYGYIDKCEKDSDRLWQTITCYDAMYSKFSTTYLNSTYPTVYTWYNKFFGKNKKTLKQLRESLFTQLGIECVVPSQGLPNDGLILKKRFKYKDMTVMEILQGLCQINGCFGKMTRDNKFEFVFISSSTSDTETLDYYRSVTYQDAIINPITSGITLRNNSDDAGITVTDDRYHTDTWDDSDTDDALIDDSDEITSGNYIIDGNMFAYKLSKKNKQIAISNIYHVLGTGTNFREFKAESNGIPYLECGDKVSYTKADGDTITFIVTNRTLSGIQSLKDTYDSSVDKDTIEYVSTPQKCVSNVKTSITTTDATDIANESISNTLGGDGVSNMGYMYVVSWDASTGILETSSGA